MSGTKYVEEGYGRLGYDNQRLNKNRRNRNETSCDNNQIKNEKQRRKELKKQYKGNLLRVNEFNSYLSNIKIKCNGCRQNVSPLLGNYGRVECPKCKHEFGHYSDYGNNSYTERHLKFYVGINIVSNDNKTVPKNVEFNGINYAEEALAELQEKKAKLNNSSNVVDRKKENGNNNKKYVNVQGNELTFEDCFKKHFPLGYQNYAVLSMLNNVSVEEYTSSILKNYDGSFELEDALLGALIIHVGLGNVNGYNLDTLLHKLNWSKNFEDEIRNNFIGFNTKRRKYVPVREQTAKFSLAAENDNLGKYDFDENGNVVVGGGFDRSGYDSEGYDSEGYNELGYQKDDFD